MSQVRDNGGIDQNGGSGDWQWQLDLRYILEVEATVPLPPKYIGRLERGLPLSDLNNWGIGSAIHGDGEY